MTTLQAPRRPAGGDPGHRRAPAGRRLGGRVARGHLAMLLAALVAVVANYAVLRGGDDAIRVAVAAADLVPGHQVAPADLAYVDVQVGEDVLAGLVPADVAGERAWVTATVIGAGELIRASDLLPADAAAMPRAMSIPVALEHAVAGDLRPGDRVDVIEVDGASARYLLSGAEVLAVPPTGGGGIGGALHGFSVTVAVDEASALELAVAIRAGQIELVRSTGATRTDGAGER